jgi:hypothetical protein
MLAFFNIKACSTCDGHSALEGQETRVIASKQRSGQMLLCSVVLLRWSSQCYSYIVQLLEWLLSSVFRHLSERTEENHEVLVLVRLRGRRPAAVLFVRFDACGCITN